jgi:HTH-type transcriptional regulator / antitoxin HipB
MAKKTSNLTTLDELIEAEYGSAGSPKREKFEKGYETFKIGFLIQQARLKRLI